MMRKVFLTIVVFIPTMLLSQDSLFRAESPVAAKIGFGGVGLDLALGNLFGIDAATWVLSSSFNARYYLFNKNASPFIGIGVGTANGGFGGNGENKWTVGIVGWEHSYKVFMVQIGLQVPIAKQNSYGFSPFIVNLNLGARVN